MSHPAPLLLASLTAGALLLGGCATDDQPSKADHRTHFLKSSSGEPVKRTAHEPNPKSDPDHDPATTRYLR
jgi:hypothetical protein